MVSAMCFELDSLPPIPAIAGAAVSHDDLTLEAADGNALRRVRGRARTSRRGVGVVVLPDVRGLYRFYEELALRFAERGYDGGRDRLLRPHRGRRQARRRLPVHGARRADDAGGHPGRRRRRGRLPPLAGRRLVPRDLHRRLLLRRPQLVARRRPAATASRARSASTAMPGERNGQPGPTQLAGDARGADPRAPGRRRPEHHARAQRRVRRGAHRGRRRARGRHLRRRAAQLLRPPLRGVRRRVRQRLEPRARLHRAARRTSDGRRGSRPTSSRPGASSCAATRRSRAGSTPT